MRNAWIYDEVPFDQYIFREREQALFEARVQLDQVDSLGPANAEQRAEKKAAARARRRAALRHVGLMAAFYAVMAFGAVAGLVFGALNPDMVLGVLP